MKPAITIIFIFTIIGVLGFFIHKQIQYERHIKPAEIVEYTITSKEHHESKSEYGYGLKYNGKMGFRHKTTPERNYVYISNGNRYDVPFSTYESVVVHESKVQIQLYRHDETKEAVRTKFIGVIR